MIKYTLELDKNQLRALSYLVDENPCNSGCCYNEMEKSKKDCDNCKFTKAQFELIQKIESLSKGVKL